MSYAREIGRSGGKQHKGEHMTEPPTALRLADALDVGEISYTGMCKVAAELRRLHALNGELLEALKALTAAPDLSTYGLALHNARAVIAKAEGEV
jgi:hypothetical protein